MGPWTNHYPCRNYTAAGKNTDGSRLHFRLVYFLGTKNIQDSHSPRPEETRPTHRKPPPTTPEKSRPIKGDITPESGHHQRAAATAGCVLAPSRLLRAVAYFFLRGPGWPALLPGPGWPRPPSPLFGGATRGGRPSLSNIPLCQTPNASPLTPRAGGGRRAGRGKGNFATLLSLL